VRFKNLDFNKSELAKTSGDGYSYAASYSRKDDLRKGLVLSGQLIFISGASYLTGLLARELWFSSMASYVPKFEKFSEKLKEPQRIPAYDEDGKEFYLEEYKELRSNIIEAHEAFKQRLRELPIIKDIPLIKEIPNFIADQIQNTENKIIEDFVKEYGPSMFYRMVNEQAMRYFFLLIWMGVDPKEAQQIIEEVYNKMISSQNLRESVERYIREDVAKPYASYKMVEIEADYLGSAVGAATFLGLSSLALKDEIKLGLRKANSGIKHLYKKILTGGREEIEED
jgi:hypothetical protein